MSALGLLVLRLMLAALFVAHGAHILFGAFAGAGIGPGGLNVFAAYYASVGLSPSYPLAVAAGAVQLLGGLLLGIGFLTRSAGISLLVIIGLDAWKSYERWGVFLNWMVEPGRGHGLEHAMLLSAAVACLALAGPGAWSIDGRRAGSEAARAAGRARLRGR